ncbi:DUF3142 domain-containing protein [Pontixanthobacter luteolus]|uniref:DUF3142 domain-containing protein n=1 Tax=Pontixanthobacter luteolus TaxID=295089 RepID=UPI0030B82505
MLLSACLLAGCGPGRSEAARVVDPADYSAFFLWSGVEPPPAMDTADTVYVLWGELRKGDAARIIPLHRTPPARSQTELWMVIRAERLDWAPSAMAQMRAQVELWQRVSGIAGVQIDFDSSTGRLGDYAVFLKSMRRELPAGLKLSATGLMDWPANADEDDLAALRAPLDEIVIQTYRETTTIADFGRYLQSAHRLAMPYKIALVEGGAWDEPAGIANDPDFRGYVVFLLPQKRVQNP